MTTIERIEAKLDLARALRRAYPDRHDMIELEPDAAADLLAIAKAAKNRMESFDLGTDATGRDAGDEWRALRAALENV